MIWKINKSNKVISNGQVSFTIDKIKNENNKKEYYIMLNDFSVAKYSTYKFAEYVLIKLVEYLNKSENKAFKFPNEEQVLEMIKNDSN